MSRKPTRPAHSLAARLGFPPQPDKHPDPIVRRAYWRAVKQDRAARKLARALATAGYCPRRLGRGTCGEKLERSTDRLGRVVVSCLKCDRRDRGICRRCPRPITGNRARGASYCDTCRPIAFAEACALAEERRKWHYLETKRLNSARRRKRLKEALASPDPAIRAAAEALKAQQRKSTDAASKRFRIRQKRRKIADTLRATRHPSTQAA